uniref:Uncharacterized protein n=1 Tax=Anopheles arabiensis TaxID=7173 RepID=A0A182IF98_ANOAR
MYFENFQNLIQDPDIGKSVRTVFIRAKSITRLITLLAFRPLLLYKWI